jgi:oligopeptide/dipeptide ABC transporter ATP-binding protein
MVKPIISIRNLNVWFSTASRLSRLWGGGSPNVIKAVDGINLDLYPGESLALVGESGSGKTTLARAMMALLRETRGEIRFEGRNVVGAKRAQRLKLRSNMQMIFQDPFDSMNPRETIFKIVSEPLAIHRPQMPKGEILAAAVRTLSDVGLKPPEDFLFRHPHELSGGQCQRVLIASALVLDPRVIIADEPVSMLDPSSKVEILNLLVQLKENHPLSYLLITHDMALARYVADRVAVMYLGAIIELGPIQQVLGDPRHPYTRALINVVPSLDAIGENKEVLKGEIPHPSNIPTGCRFHPRCPLAADDCVDRVPEMKALSDQRFAACHRV